MTDFTKIQMSSKASSNKVWKQGVGQFSVSALGGIGEVNGVAVIPHGFGSDNLLYQVSASTDLVGTSQQTTLPWQSTDGRVTMYACVDNNNLTIVRIDTDASGLGFPAVTVSYSYRLLVP